MAEERLKISSIARYTSHVHLARVKFRQEISRIVSGFVARVEKGSRGISDLIDLKSIVIVSWPLPDFLYRANHHRRHGRY